MIKLSIIINDAAYEQAKLLAEESGLGVAEWIEELINDTCEPEEEDPIAALESRVAAIEEQLQRREAAKEEATEVDSGSQEDEARCHATEEEFEVITDGFVMKGDFLERFGVTIKALMTQGMPVSDVAVGGVRVLRPL